MDLDHEDLADNIFTNWVEYHGTDGVDDDFNGYVDDVHGWDFAENNNDPNPVIDNQDHGTHVSGWASAVTNNGKHVVSDDSSATVISVGVPPPPPAPPPGD